MLVDVENTVCAFAIYFGDSLVYNQLILGYY